MVTNGNGVEAESIIEVRALDALGNPTGPTITLTVFSQNGVVSDVWGYATDTLRSNGMLSESFFLSENSVSSLDLDAHNELPALFPSFENAPTTFGKTAVLSLKKYDAEVWCEYLAA